MMVDEKSERLSAHEVAAWLRRHPKFLEQYPDLAVSLIVPKEEGKAASLASYQLDVLRDKNRELTRRLSELFANAQDNERLAVRTHHLTLALMRAPNAAETLKAMVAVLGEDFQGDAIRVLVFAPVLGLEPAPWWQQHAADSTAMKPFTDFLLSNEPLCGRLNQDKLSVLYGVQETMPASCVLLPLSGFGLLCVGSQDANRFYPGMGTLFLRLMSEALVSALNRYTA
jgi:uncharacterized protein